MLNLNYNINKAIGGGGCIGVMKYNYSASIVVAAGGGGGSTGDGNGVGGGGGGGMAISQSISIIPNVTYQINVGAGGAVNQDAIGNSFLIGFDDNDTIPISFLCEGGKTGTSVGAGINNGGNSGSGSLVRAGVVTPFAARAGGTGSYSTSGGFGAAVAGGGGASNQANGANGTTASTQARGGTGASGMTAGGGGGATAGGPTPPPDSQNGLSGSASSNAGIGGNGSGVNPSRGASAGSDGTVIITYAGQPKAFVTNATTTNDGYGNTVHTFGSGSGTFIYTFPYPYEEPVTPYQVEVCPEERTGFAPYIYPDPYSGSIVSAIPGAVFKQGYDNLFGMDNIWDDISSYVRGTGVPIGSDRTITPQGTGTIISSSATPWDRYGYPSSLAIPSSSLLNAGTDSGRYEGFNIPSASFSTSGSSFNWTAECWVALPISSSFVLPNLGIVRKSESYALDLISFTNTGTNVWVNNGESRWNGPQTASLMMTAGNSSAANQYQVNNAAGTAGSGSNTMNAFQWHHIAFSSEYTQCGPTPIDGSYTIYRGFFDGREIFAAPINMCGYVLAIPTYPSIDGQANPALLFDAIHEGLSETNSLIQDFRFYKGTNKNYTASFDVNDVYPIVIARPY
jgi:hypothetical protein